MPTCPECEAALDVEDDEVEDGEVINCPECGAELEVVQTNPIELERIEDEDEEEEERAEGEEDEDEEEDDTWK